MEQKLSAADYIRLFDLAKRVALRTGVTSSCDAEDIAHDVLVGLLRKLKQPSPHRIAFREAWVRKAAKYATYRWIKKRHLQNTKEFSARLRPNYEPTDIDLLLALHSLPHPYVKLFRMRFVDGMTIGEIARKMSISQGTVKRQLTLLVSMLRKTAL